jgi:hypothetical protein
LYIVSELRIRKSSPCFMVINEITYFFPSSTSCA